MNRKALLILLVLLALSGCSLAEDVTPPPELVTLQPVEQAPQATQQRPEPVAQATAVDEIVTPESMPDQKQGDLESDASTVTIYGTIENGTEGGELPPDLDVTFFAIDGNQIASEMEVSVEEDGTFEVPNQEIAPGRVFGAVTGYLGIQYFNTAAQILDDSRSLDLPLTVYEKTTDDDLLVVERMHLIFDFSIEGVVEVSELLLITNTGDRTVDGQDDVAEIHFTLPPEFSNLQFADPPEMMGFIEDADGFVINTAFVPWETVEAFYSFTLPYERSLEFKQPADFPIEAVVLLKPDGPPTVSGDGLMDLGVRDMGGTPMGSYRLAPLDQGDFLEVRLSGRHPAAEGIAPSSSLIIGAAVLGLAIIIIIFGWRIWSQRVEPTDEVEIEIGPQEPRDRETLIRAIAALDEMNEAGEIPDTKYKERREALKRSLVTLMETDRD